MSRCGQAAGQQLAEFGHLSSRAGCDPTPTLPLQEYEKRFEAWLDNLKYVLDYNSRHSSHWVRRAAAARRSRILLSDSCQIAATDNHGLVAG